MNRMQVLVETKLKSEIARKDRDLRRMLGHFDMLERVNSQAHEDEFSQSYNDKRTVDAQESGLQMDDVPHENEQETTQWNEWSDLDKEMILIEGIEVDDDEDLAASDDGSLPDEDELPEYEEIPGIDSVHIEDAACHSPPSYVEDVASHLSKTPLQPIFEETTCEVSEDD